MMGLDVSKRNSLFIAIKPSDSLSSKVETGEPSSMCRSSACATSSCSLASLSLPRAFLLSISIRLSTASMSAKSNSCSMISTSRMGSMLPSVCTMLSSAKHLTMCRMTSVSRMLPKNLFPKPSPLEAPATSPAMSTKSSVEYCIFSGLTMAASASSLLSGTGTTALLGSMVQKG